MRRLPLIALTTLVCVPTLVALSGCRETTLVPPRSLEGPTKIAVARGDVCLTTFENLDKVIEYTISPCEAGERGAIGVVVNERSDKLALLDLSIGLPRLVDLDPSTPGPNHLRVGRLPVDVGVSPDGTAAYTLNQLDRDVSIIDLRGPEVLAERYRVDETPVAMAVDPTAGTVVVASGSPSMLTAFGGATECGSGGEYDCDVVPSDAEPVSLELPGTVSDLEFIPQGDEAWVVYRDLQYASVVSFAPTPEGFDTPCLNGVDEKPCITANVSLTYDCSDGLDNDGDGRVDQGDPQCFGPRGAESELGNGRQAVDVCANGLDDDGDGLFDRDDPECMAASGMAEDVPTFAEPPLSACSDETDNDGDGDVDYPADAACYGPSGRTEEAVRKLGFDAIGTDTHGAFVYVTDRAGEQVLVVDRRRKRLIDAGRAHAPQFDAYDVELGIDVIPSPLAVEGAIERTRVWTDPDDDEHVVMRYDFGAYVSSNAGSVQYVETLVTFCEITGEEPVSDAEFWAMEQGERESICLEIPPFPLVSATFRVVADDPELPASCLSEEFVACAECVESGSEDCEPCEAFSFTQFDLCERGFFRDGVSVLHNPRFTLVDAGVDQARVLGNGTCEQPDAFVEALTEYAADNPSAPQDLKCTSPLTPQPFEVSAATVDPTDVAALEDRDRATLAELHTVAFDVESGTPEPFVATRSYDAMVVDDTITVTYEGALEAAGGADAVLAEEAEEDGTLWVDIGADACEADVRVGDRFQIISSPLDDCEVEGDLEYDIVQVRADAIRVAPVEGEEGLAEDVVTRSCFETAVSYAIRPVGVWTVVADNLGQESAFTSALGECVARYGADRAQSRVASGEIFQGPYYAFYMFPGYDPEAIEPTRDLSYTFQIASGFEPLEYPTCNSNGQQCVEGLYPTDVAWVPGLPPGTLLLSPDPNDNFVHVRNLDDPAQGYAVVR